MIDLEVEELDSAEAAEAFGSCARGKLVLECRQLVLAAHWADLHPADALPAGTTRRHLIGERAVALGGSGTPKIAEFAAAELAPEVKLNIAQAAGLLADALDLRHRFPRIWRLVRSGSVHDWVVRMVARRTRELSQENADRMDEMIALQLEGIGRRRLEDLIDATILRVDPERVARLVEEARRGRFVHLGQSNECGVKSMFARMDAADAIWLDGMIDRIADILRAAPVLFPGVPDRQAETREEWRAVALAVLGDPLLAARILIEHEEPDLFTVFAELPPDPERDVDLADDVDHADDVDLAQPGNDVEPAGDAAATDQRTYEHDGAVPAAAGDPASFAGDRDSTDELADRRRQALKDLLRALDPMKLVSPAILHVHCYPDDHDSPIARIEELGPTSLDQVRHWLGTGCQIELQPVIDLNDIPAVDAYEAPDRIRAAVFLRNPSSCFPYGTSVSRHQDLDHSDPFRRDADGRPLVPGQTGLHSLGPLVRREHRFRTHGRISLRQPEPGIYVWRTRFGRVLITGPGGTHSLGKGKFAQSVWRAASEDRAYRAAA